MDQPPTVSVSEEATAAILDSISDGVFTVDRDWRITSFNRAAEQITGVAREEAVGKRCSEVFRASMCEAECALRLTLRTGQAVVDRAAFIVDAEGRRIPISVSTALLRDRRGLVIGGAETFRDLTLVETLRKEVGGAFAIGDMVSRSPAMRPLLEVLPQVAASDSTVLLQGETGTGKELLARAIHGLSRRSKAPFVGVNCGALPDSLLESELFGYRRGAFTGAERDKPGRFARAQGGTLFLDEIGEVSAAMQVRLLRVLQERHYEPLGATAGVDADLRVIAASNRDLEAEVAAGRFRQDLYYRVNVVKLVVPPLRRRREDIALLLSHFIERFNRLQGKTVQGVGPKALALLLAHDYPGNVRELENLVEHAFVLCSGGLLEPRHFPEPFRSRRTAERGLRYGESVRRAETEAIRAALARHGGHRSAAARELGMHPSTLFRKLRQLDIDAPATDGRGVRGSRPAAGG